MTVLEKNIQVVKDMESAFNRGDLPAILSLLADNVDWQSPASRTLVKEIAWSRPRRSRDEVEAFFREVMDKVKMSEIEFKTFTAQDDRVIVEGTTRGSVIPTLCTYASDWVMVFTLRNGKIVRFRHYFDSADIAAAFHAKNEQCIAMPKAA
jgi:ketosteroid isomerase-like protein